MRGLYAATTVVLLVAVGVAAAQSRSAARTTCAPRAVTAAYASSVQEAVSSGRDLWGGQLLRAPGGPTYAAAQRFLTPLTRAYQWHGRTLTSSGSYYLPFSFPFTSYGSTVFALHVADGSEIITRRVGGPSLGIYVGRGSERYGSCAARLQPAHLGRGLPPDPANVVRRQC